VPVDVRDALVQQWQAIAIAIPSLDLDRDSRVAGWRNREVLAHLSLQPRLLARFLETASTEPPQVTLVANLSGTSALSDVIDQVAKRATDHDLDFAAGVERVVPELRHADVGATVTTVQGPIVLHDYLITRCVEAVVHGCDFADPVEPDPEAQAVACAALYHVMATRQPGLVDAAKALAAAAWLDVATGRQRPPAALRDACPLMT
jgi:Mycothiol maleylpyruvate isomerase N-terminal domain